jgi:lysophospholipid acyltransferase (LPLAT)-like uncharacterized protein
MGASVEVAPLGGPMGGCGNCRAPDPDRSPTDMKLKHPIFQQMAAFAVTSAASLYGRTIDWRATYFDPTLDTVHPRHSGRYIYLLWHEAMLMPLVLRGSRRFVALASEHRDGEVLAKAMQHLGWGVIRGSTNRRAVPALMRLLREDRRHICLTPDGPRGPRRTMAPGPVFLASKLGLPVVCMGYGYARPWRAKSWDRFAVPRPFSRGRAVIGPAVTVPPDLDRAGLEGYRLWLEKLLTWVTDEAERWATSGESRPGEAVMARRFVPHCMDRDTAPTAPPLPPELAAEWASLADPGKAAA